MALLTKKLLAKTPEVLWFEEGLVETFFILLMFSVACLNFGKLC